MPEEPNKVPTNEIPELTTVPSFDIEPATNASQPITAPADTSSAQQPTAPSVQHPVAAPMGIPPKKSKTGIIAGSIIGGLIVLMGASSALAYNFWYQNPDKVIADAVTKMVTGAYADTTTETTAKLNGNGIDGTMRLVTKSNNKLVAGTLTTSLTMNQPIKLSLKDIVVDVTGVYDGDGYIRINDADKVVDQILDAYTDYMASGSYGAAPSAADVTTAKAEMKKMIDPIVAKINNKWVKFPTSDDTETSKEQKCVADTVNKLKDNKELTKELTKAYKDNKFVVVKEKLPVKDGSFGYILDIDQVKSKSFGEAFGKTKFATELKKCSDTLDTSSSSSLDSSENNPFKDARFELRIDRWSHKITGASLEGKIKDATSGPDSFSVETKIDYTALNDLSAPKDSIDYKELQKEFDAMDNESQSKAVSTGMENAEREAAIETYRSNNRGKQPTEQQIQDILKQQESSRA